MIKKEFVDLTNILKSKKLSELLGYEVADISNVKEKKKEKQLNLSDKLRTFFLGKNLRFDT